MDDSAVRQRLQQASAAGASSRRAAAHHYERGGRMDQADRLRREASMLESAVDPGEGDRTGR